MSKIIITHCPINSNKEEVFAMIKYDSELQDAIKKYSEHLTVEKIEVFERKGNIIATERGYYFAFYSHELIHA